MKCDGFWQRAQTLSHNAKNYFLFHVNEFVFVREQSISVFPNGDTHRIVFTQNLWPNGFADGKFLAKNILANNQTNKPISVGW